MLNGVMWFWCPCWQSDWAQSCKSKCKSKLQHPISFSVAYFFNLTLAISETWCVLKKFQCLPIRGLSCKLSNVVESLLLNKFSVNGKQYSNVCKAKHLQLLELSDW